MSLRARVLLGTAFIAAVLLSTALLVARTTEAHLVDQIDDQLAAVGIPGPLIRSGIRPPTSEPPGAPERLSPLYVGYVNEDGSVATIFEPNLLGGSAPLPDISGAAALRAAGTGEPFTVASKGTSTRYRVRAISDDLTGIVQVVALPLDDTDAAIARLVVVEIAATVVALGALALVAWWVIHLGVRPVKDMADAAAAIAGGDLSRRVPEGNPHTEAGELGIALNQMLGRIEDSFEQRASTERRLRQFVADASHELRTPITTIRGYAELYEHGGLAERTELDDAMRRTSQEAARMGGLVDDMLQLARLDQDRALRLAPVDLAALARDACSDALVAHPDRSIAVSDADGADGRTIVEGDSDMLRQVLANLLGNAAIHTPPGTPVRVELRGTQGGVVLEVVDQGPGMDAETAALVFERFYREDPSRSRLHGGAGLGLAIVQSIVQAHHGSVELISERGSGTTVRVTLPTTQAHRPSSSDAES